MTTTSLSTLLNRMDRWQIISTVEEQYKVKDLDEAFRTLRREIVMPWNLKKSSLKIFHDVLEYPMADDHDELAFLDDSANPNIFSERPRFRFTSIKEFYENPDYRNDLAEIWDGAERYLGVRYNSKGQTSQVLNNAEDEDDWTVSGDATSAEYQTVVFKDGNGSIKISITNSTDSATIKNTFTAFSDANYKRKYQFKLIYLDAVPDSGGIEMRFQVDDSNYLTTTVTTQFSGQSFKADAWNLIAQDLNEATEVGTITTASEWASEIIIPSGLETGTYFIDHSDLREWSLMDYWYYSNFSVATVGATEPDQEYFLNSSEVYATDSSIVGDTEWTDVIMYDAMLTTLTDKEVKPDLYNRIYARRQKAWDDLINKYPSLEPVITTLNYRFTTDFNNEGNYIYD